MGYMGSNGYPNWVKFKCPFTIGRLGVDRRVNPLPTIYLPQLHFFDFTTTPFFLTLFHHVRFKDIRPITVLIFLYPDQLIWYFFHLKVSTLYQFFQHALPGVSWICPCPLWHLLCCSSCHSFPVSCRSTFNAEYWRTNNFQVFKMGTLGQGAASPQSTWQLPRTLTSLRLKPLALPTTW